MRALSAPTITEKNKTRGKQIRTLLEIDAVGGTLYFSDQPLTDGVQNYAAKVMDFERIESQMAPGENVVLTSGWRVKLSNNPSIASIIKPGQQVRGYLWFANLGAADKVPFFLGTIKGPSPGDLYDITINCEDIGEFHNVIIGDLLDPDTYPNADPDDWNRMISEVFGPVNNLPCLWMEAGAVTTLTSDISDSYTGPIPVADTSRFPSSGTVVSGEEKISYTSKTATTLAGTITRGVSGTTATPHSRGDAVLENVATVKGIASNNKCKSLSNARILPYGLQKMQDAVSVDSFATYNTNDSGQGTVTLADLGTIRRKVAIAVTQQPNQPVSSLGSHPHTAAISGPSQSTLFGNGINSQHDVTNPSSAFDQNENTYAELLPHADQEVAYLGLDFNYSGFDGLSITEAVACIRHLGAITPTTWRLDLNSVSWQQNLGSYSTATTQKFIVSALNGQTDWSKLNGLRAYFHDGPIGGIAARRVYEIWWEIKYTPSVAVNAHAADGVTTSRTIDAEVGGDSVAAQLGGRLYVAAEGWPDETPAHYTGTAGALIEKSADVFHKILETYPNELATGPITAFADGGGGTVIVTSAAHSLSNESHVTIIGTTNYNGAFQISAVTTDTFKITDTWVSDDATGTWTHYVYIGSFANDLPASYTFGFAITEQIELNRLLAGLAWQCWCRFVWTPDGAKLIRIKETGIPVKSIDTDTDSFLDSDNRLQVKFTIPGLDDEGIANHILLHYNLDLTLGGWNNLNAYQGLKTPSDSVSIGNYKTRKKILRAFAIADNSPMATDLAGKFLTRYAVARRTFSFPSTLKNIELETGDTPKFTCTQLGLVARLCEVLAIDYLPPVPIRNQGSETLITLLDLLYILLSGGESVGVGDFGKVDIEAKGGEASVVSDFLDYVTKVVFGFYGGGYDSGSGYNVIDYIETITANVNAADKGDLTVTRDGLGGVHGSVYGFFGGGWFASTTDYDVIDYIDVTTTTTDALDKGDLTVARHGLAGVHGSTYGFFGGGSDGSDLNVIDYIDVTTTSGDASDKGDLTVARRYLAGVSGNTYGFFGGGISLGQDVIDYIDVTTTSGNASDKGDLTVARSILAGISGSAYGFFGGGYTGSVSNIIDYIDITTTSGNASDKGDLTVARRGLAGVSGDVFGFYGGGRFSHNIIDYIDMTTTTNNALDKSDLTVGRGGSAGVSGE